MAYITLPLKGNTFAPYSIKSLSAGTSDVLVIPTEVTVGLVFSLVRKSAGSAKVQFSNSHPDDIYAGNANWQDWSAGSVTATTNAALSRANAYQVVVSSGSWDFEITTGGGGVLQSTGGGGGGGGGAVTVADGADVAQGSTTDAAITNPASAGTLISFIKGLLQKLPSQGQTTMSASQPVAIASDQTAVPISAASLPLPTGAATAANQSTEITALQSMDAKLPAKGQTTMANSQPIAVASDQPAIETVQLGIVTPQTSDSLVSVADTVVVGITTGMRYSLCVQVPVNTAGATWTVQFEKSTNGSSWSSASVTPKTLQPNTANVTSATDIGLWFYTAGATDNFLRIRLSAISGLAGGLRGYIDCLSIPNEIINLPYRAGLTADITTNTYFVPPIEMSGLHSPTVEMQAFAGTSQALTPLVSGLNTMTATTNVTTTAWANIGSTTGAPASTVTGTGVYRAFADGKYFGVRITHTAITSMTVGQVVARAGFGIGIAVAEVSNSPTVSSNPAISTSASGSNTFSHTISAATTNATSVKASAGSVSSITLSNNGASVAYFKLYNKASAPTVGTDTPIKTILIPVNGSVVYAPAYYDRMSTGIAFAITGGMAVADTTAVAVSQVAVGISYA